jgi:hypothetical protein
MDTAFSSSSALRIKAIRLENCKPSTADYRILRKLVCLPLPPVPVEQDHRLVAYVSRRTPYSQGFLVDPRVDSSGDRSKAVHQKFSVNADEVDETQQIGRSCSGSEICRRDMLVHGQLRSALFTHGLAPISRGNLDGITPNATTAACLK